MREIVSLTVELVIESDNKYPYKDFVDDAVHVVEDALLGHMNSGFNHLHQDMVVKSAKVTRQSWTQ